MVTTTAPTSIVVWKSNNIIFTLKIFLTTNLMNEQSNRLDYAMQNYEVFKV